VLRVDGLKQKCLAAHHAGIAHVVLPKQNEADLSEIPAEILNQVHVHLVSNVAEALDLAVGPSPSGWGTHAPAPPA